MPRALALALSASSNGLGTRMLICSSFFSNSNRTGLNCEKSSPDRSCAKNLSAALSVLSFGTFFFISRNLPGVHVAGRHRADVVVALFGSQGEGHKYGPTGRGPSDGNHVVLLPRVFCIGRNAGTVDEQRLDFRDGNAVLLALGTVAAVPVKPRYPQSHHSRELCKCIYIPIED